MRRLRILFLLAISLFSVAPASAYAFDFSLIAEKAATLKGTFLGALLPIDLAANFGGGTKPYRVVYTPQNTKPRWAHAQTAGFGGGSGMLVTYYREVTPPGGAPPTGGTAAVCPAGWTTAVHGYGPHYIGVTTYGLLVNGVEQGWTDTWWYPADPGGSYRGPGGEVPPDSGDPPDPPPPPEPGTPHGGGGNNGGGGEGGEPADPPPPPEPAGPTTPSEGGGSLPPPTPEEAPNGGQSANIPYRQQFASAHPGKGWRLVKVAHAQTLPTGQEYFVKDLAIGSDSVCSDSENVIVPFEKIYTNMTTPKTWSAESSACFTNATTGIKVCNRCRVCVK